MSDQRIDTGAEAATSTDADPGEGQGTADTGAHADPLDPQGLRASGDDTEMAQPTADGPGVAPGADGSADTEGASALQEAQQTAEAQQRREPDLGGWEPAGSGADQPPAASGSGSAVSGRRTRRPERCPRRRPRSGGPRIPVRWRPSSGTGPTPRRRTRSPGPRSRGRGGPRPARRSGSRRPGTAPRAPAAGAAGAARGVAPAGGERRHLLVRGEQPGSSGRPNRCEHRQVGLPVPAVRGRVDQPAAPSVHSTLPFHRSPCSRAGGSAGPASTGSRSQAARTGPPRRPHRPASRRAARRADPGLGVEAGPRRRGRLPIGAAPM